MGTKLKGHPMRFFFILIMVFFPVCLLADNDQQVEAEINGHPITTLDIRTRLILNNQYGEFFADYGGPLNPKQKAIWSKMLETLIEERIFLDLAHDEGVRLTAQNQKVIELRVQEMVSRFGSLSTLKLTLKKRGLTLRDIRSALANQMLIRSFIYKKLSTHFNILPGEMKEFYLKLKKKYPPSEEGPQDQDLALLFDSPSFKIQQIQIWTKKDPREARRKAQKALGDLKMGISFDRLVQKYSDGPRAKAKGIWALSSQEDLREPEVQKRLASLKVKDVSPVLPTSYGFVILRIIERKKLTLKPFYQVQELLSKILRKQKYEKILDNLRKKLKKKAYIKRYNL